MNQTSLVKGGVHTAGAAKNRDPITPVRAIANPNSFPKAYARICEVGRSGRPGAEKQRAKNCQLLFDGGNDHEVWLERSI